MAKKKSISSGLALASGSWMGASFGALYLSLACFTSVAFAADLHAPAKETVKSSAQSVKTGADVAKAALSPAESNKSQSTAKKVVESPNPTSERKKDVAESSKPVDPHKVTAESTKTKPENKAGSGVSIVHIKARRPGPMLVPPPPPDTPTMMPTFGDESTGLMPMEYMSPELLQKRKQDLVAQLADAKSDLKQKQNDVDSVREKAVQFKTLFDEGVISRRELEAAQKEAGEIDSSVNRAQLRVSELQTLLDGVNGRWNQINKNGNKKKVSGTGVVKRLSSKPHRTH